MNDCYKFMKFHGVLMKCQKGLMMTLEPRGGMMRCLERVMSCREVSFGFTCLHELIMMLHEVP